MNKNNPTIAQHYVPRYYLNAWCDRTGVLFAKRYNEPAFRTNPNGIAFENKLYEFKPIDYEVFTSMVADAKRQSSTNGTIPSVLQSLLLLNAYASIANSLREKHCLDANAQKIIDVCRRENIVDQETGDLFRIIAFCDANKLEIPAEVTDKFSTFLTEGQEPLMTAVENDFWPILDSARQGMLSLPLSNTDIERFITYVITQLFRTRKYFNLLQRQPPAISQMSSYLLPRMIMGAIVGMMQHQHDYELTLIVNATALPFITGDQPLLNLLAQNDNLRYLDLFFPISPNRAFFYATKGRLENCYHWLKELGESEVHWLNERLCKNCSQFVFARDEETLNCGGYAVPKDDNVS